ncbi:snakin-1 [Vitis vinifera]|nr:snakin-1 [Vitis vinifera]|eukprot:XP_002271730.2 PREDICTED: snakin-1 [Vitis vinifera]
MTAFIVYYYSHCPPPVITSPALLTIKYSVILFSSHTTLIHSSLLLSSNIITMKHLFPTLLLLSLLLHSCFSQPTTDGAGFCGLKCSKRCSQAAVLDRCMKYCGICCQECKCVPSGTYGNKHECPCYRDKKNSKGKPKCP